MRRVVPLDQARRLKAGREKAAPVDDVAETLAKLEQVYHEEPLTAERAAVILDKLASLPPDAARRFLRGKKVKLWQALFSPWHSSPAAPSTAYEWARAVRCAHAAHELGLVNFNRGCRDRETGRRMKTVLRELGRLDLDWDSPAIRLWLREVWPWLRAAPLEEVKQWVQESNPRAKLSKFEREGRE